MTTKPLRPNLPEEEDSWTDLAEDLFGIDFDQTLQSGEYVSPEELLAEDDRTHIDSEQTNDPALTAEAEESVEAEHSEEAEQSEEAEESPILTIEAETIEAEAIEQEAIAAEAFPSIGDMPEPEGVGDEVPASERDGSTDKPEKDDKFWDVLDDWNWDEGKSQVGKTDRDSREPERSRTRSSSFEREQPVSSRIVREEDDFSSVEDLHDEYTDDSDFGAGLLSDEEEPVSESEISDSPVEETIQAEEPQSKTPRSRRRRRRPRRSKKDTGDVETVPEGDGTIARIEESPDASDSSDQSGEDNAAEATPRKRTSRRRSSRSRKKQSDSPASERGSKTPQPTGESEEFGESILDEEFEPESEESSGESHDLPSKSEEQSKTSHRDVPTWEEAISYLLSPKPSSQAGSEAKTAQLGTATKDSSESSKSPNRRRRRRR